jgi:TonB family protein
MSQAGTLLQKTTPAIPIERMVPSIPVQLKTMLIQPTVVEVLVTIDAGGKVVKAEPVKAQVHPLLRLAAVQAARSWKFQPATESSRPVEADMVLRFTFTPAP